MNPSKLIQRSLLLGVCAAVGVLASARSARAQVTGGVTAGQNVVGTVTDATTGKVMANATVTLLELQNGMSKAGTTTTGSRGHYRFSESSSGPFMVEVDHQGVSYYAQVQTGQSETDVKVYDVSHDASAVQVGAEIMVLQPDAGQLAVVNEYRIENDLTPARTLAAASAKAGLFKFSVPPSAQIDMVRIVPPDSTMPLKGTEQAAGRPGVYVVPTPLRPGETRIEISYRVPYATMRATLTEKPAIRPANFEVYVPSPMTFSGAGMTQLGTQDGYTVYGPAASPVPVSMTFSVAGNAPLPTATASASDSGTGAAGSGSAEASSAAAAPAASTGSVAVGPVPTPTFMERNLWTMVIFLGLAAAGGFGYMLSRPEVQAQAASAPAGGAKSAVPAPAAAKAAQATAQPAAATPSAAPADALIKLKDDLFFLEVQHHTGRISEEEYTRQRAELDRRMTNMAGRS